MNATKVVVVGGFPLEKPGGVEEDEVGRQYNEEQEQRPFFSLMPRGLAAGSGEMACLDRGCAHVWWR